MISSLTASPKGIQHAALMIYAGVTLKLKTSNPTTAGQKDCVGTGLNDVRQTATKVLESKRGIVAYAMDLLHLLNQEASCIDSTQ